MKYIVGYTWDKFLCTMNTGPTVRLPCDRGDALVCDGGWLLGVHSYGYDTGPSSMASGAGDCGDPAVQNRHLFVNRYVRWIAKTVFKHGARDKSIQWKKVTVAGENTVSG